MGPHLGQPGAVLEGARLPCGPAAVNALLDTDGSTASRCRVRRLHRPPEPALLHRIDESRYRSGPPNLFDRGQAVAVARASLDVISFGVLCRLSIVAGIVERLVPDELWELF
ncbi:hypothetical protein AB0F18_36990, partial [Streptomyces sp. NPDC029216]